MNIVHRGGLRRVEFTLVTGYIFAAPVDAIVNSEQTDFVLSGNPDAISGQIWDRYGHAVQNELNAATAGQVLGSGTVVDTSGGGDFKRIFHAGFHEPDDWPGAAFKTALSDIVTDPRDSLETDYFAAIGSCISQILERALAQKLESVAFPLIGCGRFGLDEKMLILQFLDAIEEFDGRLPEGERLHVWLVIRDRAQFESVAGTFLDLLMQARSKLVSVRLRQSGVSILDRFADRLLERMNEDWAKWQLCRYAEIATEVMCYAVSRATPACTPESLFDEGRPVTFGSFLVRARELSSAAEVDKSAWGVQFFSRVLKEPMSARALDAITQQRNNLAHGRSSLPLGDIRRLIAKGLSLEAWERIVDTDGALQLAAWQPWIAIPSRGARHMGLFERWQKNSMRYLVPETGEIFSLPRSPTPAANNR